MTEPFEPTDPADAPEPTAHTPATDSRGQLFGAFIARGHGPGTTPAIRRALNLIGFALAIIGGLAGLWTFWGHLVSNPLVDVRAYYDAATRLNAGLPLYPPDADPNLAGYYRYPPLMAIVLRPFALLPYPIFAALWVAAIVGGLAWTLRRIGLGRRTWFVLGWLGIPLGWTLAIGQAHVFVTMLLTLGTPMSIALAAHLKVFPILAALYWIGRGEVGYVTGFLGWLVGLSVVQAFLEPAGWSGFWGISTLEQVGQVVNFSPFEISPMLWLILLGAGVLATLALARTRFGWPAAVALATLAPPRLLLYQLSSLLAALREPEPDSPDVPPPPDAAEIYVSSAR
jgi:hypothetical protein